MPRKSPKIESPRAKTAERMSAHPHLPRIRSCGHAGTRVCVCARACGWAGPHLPTHMRTSPHARMRAPRACPSPPRGRVLTRPYPSACPVGLAVSLSASRPARDRVWSMGPDTRFLFSWHGIAVPQGHALFRPGTAAGLERPGDKEWLGRHISYGMLVMAY